MRQLAILSLSVLSLVFFIGSKCNSGDFNDSYIFCTPGCTDSSGHCLLDNTTCSGNECTTGLQTFLNGQNECNTLEDDGLNNNCGNSTPPAIAIGPDYAHNILQQRIDWYNSIGCTGGFGETDPVPPPSPVPS